jgi:hypothetical protein
MLYTFGKILFPKLLHREKTLRARMRWVAGIFGLILIAGVIAMISLTHRMDFSSKKIPKPFTVRATEPPPR